MVAPASSIFAPSRFSLPPLLLLLLAFDTAPPPPAAITLSCPPPPPSPPHPSSSSSLRRKSPRRSTPPSNHPFSPGTTSIRPHLWHSHFVPGSGAADAGAADANNDGGRRQFRRWRRRQRTCLLYGPRNSLNNDAFIAPLRKERRVAVVDAHDLDDGDNDGDPAFFAALVTPSTMAPLSSYQLKAASSSFPCATAYSAMATGYASFKSLRDCQEVDPSFH